MANAVNVTDANFAQEVEKHDGLACRLVAPILDDLASVYAGKAKVTKLDVDANQATAMRFNVRSIPTILFFKDGKLVDQVIGAVPRGRLEAKFKEHMNGG
jgi:thioredoxin 1